MIEGGAGSPAARWMGYGTTESLVGAGGRLDSAVRDDDEVG